MRSSIELPEVIAQGIFKPGTASSAARQRMGLRKCRLGVTGWVVWAVASTLQPAPQAATAAPPASHPHSTVTLPARHHHASQHHAPHYHASGASATYGYVNLPQRGSVAGFGSVAGPAHSCGCGSCGKKRKSFARKLLDGVTAGTDRLIFGSSHPGGSDCDSGCDSGCDTACDAIGSIPDPAGRGHLYAPQPISPAIDLLPAPLDSPPLPPRGKKANPGASASEGSALESSSPKHPTSKIQRDQLRDPFADDPVNQGANPAISRSAYYE